MQLADNIAPRLSTRNCLSRDFVAFNFKIRRNVMKNKVSSALSRLKREGFTLKRVMLFALSIMVITGTAIAINSIKEGLIEYVGTQKEIFKTGKAASVISLESLADRRGLFAVGPVDGLDGEITIFDSKAYITKVRGDGFTMDHSYNHGAFFLLWTEQTRWQDVPVPETVKGYVDLQQFVKAQAQVAGIDVTKPFPFLLAGTPVEVKWHINVDRTEGKPITKELFVKSKQPFVTENEPVDIVGFYAEDRVGVYMAEYAPAIKKGSGIKNSIHIHLVSRTGKAAGHIDDLLLGKNMVLRLPKL
jgi:acetolactate decarboxylase